MGVGYRFFVISGENVTRVSQKSVTDFYLNEKPSLPRFKGQVVTIATVVCETRSRVPVKIIKIDTQRVRVGSNGDMEDECASEIVQLIARHLLGDESLANPHGEKVINALPSFDERRWSVMHPELSGPQTQKILDDLFG